MIKNNAIYKIPFDITFHPSWWCKNAGVEFGKEFFYNPEYRIEADIQMRKVLFEKFGEYGLGEKNPKPRPIIGSDLIAGEYLQSQILGCDILFSKDNLPEVVCKKISEDQLKMLKTIELGSSEAWNAIITQMDYLEDKYGYIESHLDLHGVQNLALDLRGEELFIDYYDQPDIAEGLLAKCSEVIGEIGKYIQLRSQTLSVGVTSIMKKIDPTIFVTSNCTVELVSNKIYEEFLLKWDNYLSTRFEKFGIHHCGQTLQHLITGYSKVKNVSFVEVGAFSDIKAARQAFPDTFLNLRYSPVRIKEVSGSELMNDINSMIHDGYEKCLTSISCVGIDGETEVDQIKQFLSILDNLEVNV